MKSPREQFRESPYAKSFADVIQSSQMEAAMNAATLELQERFQPTCDPQEAAANEFRRQGARSVLVILRHLTVSAEPAPSAPSKANLNPRV